MADTLPQPTDCCAPTCCDETTVAVPGPAGADGAAGAAGTNGTNAVTTVNQVGGFAMPAIGASVSIVVVSSAGFTAGQYVFIQNAGYMKLTAKSDSTHMTLLNEGYPGNAPATTTIADLSSISPAGIKGLDGGVDFSTTTTASFVMPKANTAKTTATRARASNVATLTTGSAHGLATGDYVVVSGVSGSGYNVATVQITVTGASSFTYANTGSDEGATADTGGTVKANVTIAVTTSLGFIAGQQIFIQTAGFFYLQSVPTSTSMIVQNLALTNNATAGTTIASGVRVSVSITMNSISPTTTKGDLIVDNGANSPLANDVALSVGSNGKALVADSTTATGLAYATITPNTVTADNVISRYDGATGTPVPLQTSLMLISDTGALQSTPSGGNARGASAIDLQVVRAAATQVASGTAATQSGGENNTASASHSTVGGGLGNVSSASTATVSGGDTNSAIAVAATVGGGVGNASTVANATTGGGTNNTAGAAAATVAGGNSNTVLGTNGAVGGGNLNTVGGTAGCVPGGSECNAGSDYSIATGRGAYTTWTGEAAHSDGYFSVVGDRMKSEVTLIASTSNATVTEMLIAASTRLVLENDASYSFKGQLVARRTDADNDSAVFDIQFAIDRQTNAASTALVGAAIITVIGRDSAAWTVAVSADTTNGAAKFEVTGEVGKTIRWFLWLTVVKVKG